MEELYKELIDMVAEVAELEPEDVGIEDSLPEEHEFNSLMGLEVLVELEKKYNVKVPETRLPEMTTIKNIAEIIKEIEAETTEVV